MSYVISRNFLSHEAKGAWQIRQADESVQAYKPHKTIIATNVSFESSNAAERGFGCSVVAVTEDKPKHKAPAKLPDEAKEIYFNGSAFCWKNFSGEVKKVKQLFCLPDKTLFAVPF